MQLLWNNGNTMPTLGDVILYRRKGLKLSQSELAREAGIDRGTVANLEGGRTSTLQNENYRRVAAALGMTVQELQAECDEASLIIRLAGAAAAEISRRAAQAKLDPAAWLAQFFSAAPSDAVDFGGGDVQGSPDNSGPQSPGLPPKPPKPRGRKKRRAKPNGLTPADAGRVR